MNERKMKQLFEAARVESAPVAPGDFDTRVMAAVRREARPPVMATSLWDQIGMLLPRLAVASLLVISVCIAADIYSGGAAPGLTASVDQLSEQWLFGANRD